MNRYSEYMPRLIAPWSQEERTAALVTAEGAVKDEEIQRMIAAVKIALLEYADEDALALIGAERGLERVPAESAEDWLEHVTNAWQVWERAGTLLGVKAALERLAMGEVIITEWGRHDPARWAEFSVNIQATTVGATRKWGQGKWGQGAWKWLGDAAPLRMALLLIAKFKPAKSKLVSLTLHESLKWGARGTWGTGKWASQGASITIYF